MRKFLPILMLTLFLSCKTTVVNTSPTKVEYDAAIPVYMKTITAKELKDMVYIFASDEFEGRNSGEPGQKKAAEYIKNYYQKIGVQAPKNDDNYYQTIPAGTFREVKNETENVLGFIPGTDKAEEVLVLSAHYDHVGKSGKYIYNGADDDASGNMAILEIAEAFKLAEKNGLKPRRSILFLHVTAEELGLLGSEYYADNPLFSLENTIANLNIDMIGRKGYGKENDDNYVYLIGSDKLSTELHNISEEVNQKYVNIRLDYKFRENDPEGYYYRSDHYNFAKNNIPIIFYFNGIHDDYHQPTDTAEKLNYELLAKRAKLIFATAWELANREERPKLDKN